MSVRQVSIPQGLRNERVPAEPKPTPEHPPDLFRLHTLAAFVGARGSGKTNACILLAHAYVRHGSFNRVFIISPTFESNPAFEVLPVEKDDVYKEPTDAQSSLRHILEKIRQDAEEYEAYQTYKEVYDAYQKGQKLDEHEEHYLQAMNHEKPVPIDRPQPLIIIDDMSHSNIYSGSRNNPFINLCLRHRHIHKTGVTLFMLVQTFRTGIPKCLRQNVQVFFIWRTQDMTQLQAIWQEFANLISWPQFVELYHFATDDDEHHFLTVDVNAPAEARFRKNFDTFLVV